jgi:hypothetical protein
MTGIDLMGVGAHMFSLIHKIMASTIRTGTVTSVFAVAALILFHTNERSNGELVRHPAISFQDD